MSATIGVNQDIVQYLIQSFCPYADQHGGFVFFVTRIATPRILFAERNTIGISTVEHPATDEGKAWMKTALTITVTPRTLDEIRVLYRFTVQQDLTLDKLLRVDNRREAFIKSIA